MAFDEDLDQFFREEDFAEYATVNGTNVLGIFETVYVETEEVEGVRPTFLAPTEKLDAAAAGATVVHGEVVVYGGKTYEVVGIEPDDKPTNNTTRLVLEEQ